MESRWRLHFVPAEDIVLLPAGALGATQAANQQNRHPGRHHQRQETPARQKPVNQTMHNRNLSNTPMGAWMQIPPELDAFRQDPDGI